LGLLIEAHCRIADAEYKLGADIDTGGDHTPSLLGWTLDAGVDSLLTKAAMHFDISRASRAAQEALAEVNTVLWRHRPAELCEVLSSLRVRLDARVASDGLDALPPSVRVAYLALAADALVRTHAQSGSAGTFEYGQAARDALFKLGAGRLGDILFDVLRGESVNVGDWHGCPDDLQALLLSWVDDHHQDFAGVLGA
jgi:hypothetical protein